jgi:hypothetical protein
MEFARREHGKPNDVRGFDDGGFAFRLPPRKGFVWSVSGIDARAGNSFCTQKPTHYSSKPVTSIARGQDLDHVLAPLPAPSLRDSPGSLLGRQSAFEFIGKDQYAHAGGQKFGTLTPNQRWVCVSRVSSGS